MTRGVVPRHLAPRYTIVSFDELLDSALVEDDKRPKTNRERARAAALLAGTLALVGVAAAGVSYEIDQLDQARPLDHVFQDLLHMETATQPAESSVY